MQNDSNPYKNGNFYKTNNKVNPTVIKVSQLLIPGRVLDIGCGMGSNLNFLQSLGWDIYGVDRENESQLAIEKLTKSTHFFLCDVIDLPKLTLPKFDLVISNYLFQHLESNTANTLISWISDILFNESIFCFSTFLRKKSIQENILRNMITKKFNIIYEKKWKRIDIDHDNPHTHNGIEFILKKI